MVTAKQSPTLARRDQARLFILALDLMGLSIDATLGPVVYFLKWLAVV
jgi:hypothetical protein